jgi:hypothetical protein
LWKVPDPWDSLLRAKTNGAVGSGVLPGRGCADEMAGARRVHHYCPLCPIQLARTRHANPLSFYINIPFCGALYSPTPFLAEKIQPSQPTRPHGHWPITWKSSPKKGLRRHGFPAATVSPITPGRLEHSCKSDVRHTANIHGSHYVCLPAHHHQQGPGRW